MEKKFNLNGKELKVQEFKKRDSEVSFRLHGKSYCFKLIHRDGAELILEHGSRVRAYVGQPSSEGESLVIVQGREAKIAGQQKKLKAQGLLAGGATSPMPGKIFKILKPEGEEVKKGETILILEAMKMEHSIRADKDGRIKKILFKEGDLVQGGMVLAELE